MAPVLLVAASYMVSVDKLRVCVFACICVYTWRSATWLSGALTLLLSLLMLVAWIEGTIGQSLPTQNRLPASRQWTFTPHDPTLAVCTSSSRSASGFCHTSICIYREYHISIRTGRPGLPVSFCFFTLCRRHVCICSYTMEEIECPLA